MVTSGSGPTSQICGICALLGGLPGTLTNSPLMPDIAGLLLRNSIGSLSPAHDSCGECRRTPLAGERLHELDSGSLLCELCFGALPVDRRLAVRSVRVHAGERRLAVVPRAA
jgi:hypothetical protein